MTRTEIDRRLIISRRIMWRWRENLPPGRTLDTLSIVHEEIAFLNACAAEQPARAGKIGELVTEWRHVADKVMAN